MKTDIADFVRVTQSKQTEGGAHPFSGAALEQAVNRGIDEAVISLAETRPQAGGSTATAVSPAHIEDERVLRILLVDKPVTGGGNEDEVVGIWRNLSEGDQRRLGPYAADELRSRVLHNDPGLPTNADYPGDDTLISTGLLEFTAIPERQKPFFPKAVKWRRLTPVGYRAARIAIHILLGGGLTDLIPAPPSSGATTTPNTGAPA